MKSIILVLLFLLPVVVNSCNLRETCTVVNAKLHDGVTLSFSFGYDDTIRGEGNICSLPQGIFSKYGTGAFDTLYTSPPIDGLSPTSTFVRDTGVPCTGTHKHPICTYTFSLGATDGEGDVVIVVGTAQLKETKPGFYETHQASEFSYAYSGPHTGKAKHTSGKLKFIGFGSCPNVAGDPLFVGFHGQHYKVSGVPDRIFNLLSMPQLQLNSRFVALHESQVMSRDDMVAARVDHFRHSRKLPITRGAFHTGLYMGDLGFKVSGVRIYVAAGEYETGFASVTINGNEVPVSNATISVADGAAFIARRTPYTVTFSTAQLSLVVVNSDKFVNIDNVALNIPYTADLPLSGLLGVSADPDWSVDLSDINGFEHRAIDESMLEGDDIFGNDFNTNKYTVAK